jgi:hypothetical protein
MLRFMSASIRKRGAKRTPQNHGGTGRKSPRDPPRSGTVPGVGRRVRAPVPTLTGEVGWCSPRAVAAARNFKCRARIFRDIQVVAFALPPRIAAPRRSKILLRGEPGGVACFVLDKCSCVTQIRRASSTPPGAPPEVVAFRGE